MGWREHVALAITLLAFLALASQYATATPPFEMPEEPWHLRRIADTAGRALPDGHASWAQRGGVPSVERQPPLYYWIGALLVRSLDWSADASVYELNPHSRLADLQGVTNRNAMVARQAMRADESLARAARRLRLFSLAAAAASLAFTFRLLLVFTSGRRWLSLAALLVNAFLPGYVYQTSGVGPLSLGLCLTIAAIYLAIRMVEEPGYPHALIRAAAVCAGLAAMTVWWGWMAVIIVALGYRLRRKEWAPYRGTAHHGVWLALAAMLLMALVWPGQVLFSGPIEEPALLWARILDMPFLDRADLALKAFWGVFGWLNIPVGSAFYTAVGVLSILGLSGLLLRLVQWYWRTPDRTSLITEVRERIHPWQTVALAWAGLGVALIIIHLLSPSSAYLGGALLPLAPLVVLFLVLGMDTWLQTYGAVFMGAVVALFLGVALLAPEAYIEPAYARPERLTLAQLPRDLRPLDVSYGDSLYLVGYSLGEESGSPGAEVPVRLYWLAREPMSSDYSAHVTVSGYKGEMVSSVFTRAAGGVYPTSMWLPGDVVLQNISLPIDAGALAPAAGIIGLTVSEESTGEVLSPISPSGEELSKVLPITSVRIGPEREAHYVPEHTLGLSLDGQITLTGYDLDPLVPVPGDAFEVTLYWRAEGPIIHDYTVFVHLVDSDGELLDQADSQPLDGNYPTGLWTMGEGVRDHYLLEMPRSVRVEETSLEVGMYRLDTSERLLVSGDGELADHVDIGPLGATGQH